MLRLQSYTSSARVTGRWSSARTVIRNQPRCHIASTAYQRTDGAAVLRPRAIRDSLTDAEIEEAVVRLARPTVLNFTASWCGPCQLVKKELKKVEAELGAKVDIIVVDVESHKELAAKCKVRSLPTLMVVGPNEAKPGISAQGFVPAKVIKDMLLNRSSMAGKRLDQCVRLY